MRPELVLSGCAGDARASETIYIQVFGLALTASACEMVFFVVRKRFREFRSRAYESLPGTPAEGKTRIF